MNLKNLQERISEHMAGVIPEQQPEALYAPLAYCLKNGGKRMRPVMTLLGCELFNGDIEKALSPAVGLELFHNFTLMHDDIMDNAPLRRGLPAVHKKWNINTAILSGDVMFALATKYMMDVSDEKLRQVLDLFNKTVIEVCEGQQYDMNFESDGQVGEADYLEMIRLKTAVLPAACLKTGAIIADASDDDAEKLYCFGESIGLAFQLRDDWLDVYGEEAVFGKKSGGDIVANKKTWMTIKAYELADETQKELLQKAFNSKDFSPDEKIRQVKEIYDRLGIKDLALQQMEQYYLRAFDYLDSIRIPDERKEALTVFAKSLFDRKN